MKKQKKRFLTEDNLFYQTDMQQIQFLRGRTLAALGTSVGVLQKKCTMTAYIKKCNNNMSFVHSLFGPGTFSICCCSVNGPFTWGVCQGRVHSAVMHGQTESARWGQATGVETVISWLQCTPSPFSGQEQPHALLDYSVMWSRGRWLYDTCKVWVNVCLNIFFWSAE